jgi:hypothetical protein
MRSLHVTNPLSKPGKQVLTEIETTRTFVFLAPGVETGRRRASKFCTFTAHGKEKYAAVSTAYWKGRRKVLNKDSGLHGSQTVASYYFRNIYILLLR